MNLRSTGMEGSYRCGRRSKVKEQSECNEKLGYCGQAGSCRNEGHTSVRNHALLVPLLKVKLNGKTPNLAFEMFKGP